MIEEFAVGILADEDMEPFLPLMLQESVDALAQGVPLIVMGLEQDDVACGCLAGYIHEDCFRILSLFVAPDYRRKGGGRRMLRQLESLIQMGSGVHTITIEFATAQHENEELLLFLKKMGFAQESDDGYNVYCFLLEDLEHVNTDQISPKCSGGRIYPFTEISPELLRMAQKKSVAQEITLPSQPLTSEELERELSFALVVKGEIRAYVVVDHSCCDMLTLSALWIGDASLVTLNTLLKMLIAKVRKLYPPDTPVAMQAINDQSLSLIMQLAPNAKKVCYSYRKMV